MKSVRRLLVAFYVSLTAWLLSLAVADSRDRKCNPDDLTECDILGDALLGMILLLPALLLALLVFLCIATVGLLTGMSANEWLREPPVVVVIGTVGILAIVLAFALFGNLEALVSTAAG